MSAPCSSTGTYRGALGRAADLGLSADTQLTERLFGS
jgi:hypothetical protein